MKSAFPLMLGFDWLDDDLVGERSREAMRCGKVNALGADRTLDVPADGAGLGGHLCEIPTNT